MANTSTPASLRLCAGGVTSSCDFPSVMRTAILGMPGLDPDSGLKLFSRMKVRARPGRTAHTQWVTINYNTQKTSWSCKDLTSKTMKGNENWLRWKPGKDWFTPWLLILKALYVVSLSPSAGVKLRDICAEHEQPKPGLRKKKDMIFIYCHSRTWKEMKLRSWCRS